MAFIEMIDIDRNLQRTHRLYPANAEHNLLCNPFFTKPAVQLAGNPGITVLRDIRIKQVERAVAELLGFPNFADYIGFSDFNSNLNPCIFKEIIDVIVVRVIGIAVRVNLLVGVALLPF
ncbi:hypothetical protein D3C81_1412050 [compost metagenome]